MKGAWQSGVMLIVALSLLVGCGPPIDTVPVQGTVKVAGQPVPGIVVSFLPAQGRPASGTTDSSGNFKLSTLSKEDGAVAGKHRVSFAMSSIAGGQKGASSAPSYTKSDPNSKGPPTGGPASPFNSKYTRADTSGIEVEVVAGKTNEFSWDLEK